MIYHGMERTVVLPENVCCAMLSLEGNVVHVYMSSMCETTIKGDILKIYSYR